MNNSPTSLADRIDAVLPQTQCEQCGYHGCRPYAEAIAEGEADINRCPPGGAAGIDALAALLDEAVKPLDPACGTEKPRMLARVVEADCIGCTKCIQVCPVDAIVGAAKRMHSVIDDMCTGCELCVPACPVDCITLEPMPPEQLDREHADAARRHFQRRETRLQREREQRQRKLAQRKAAMHGAPANNNGAIRKNISRSAVQAAIERGKARRRKS